MTVNDLWLWAVSNELVVAVLVGALPLVIGFAALLLRFAGRHDASQQVANGGIAVGLAALLLELLGLGYAVQVREADPLRDASVLMLLGPLYLLVAGFVVEHLVHPTRQESVRSRIRGVLMVGVVLGLLVVVFSVMRIHMVIFGGILGFLLFLGAVIAAFWVMLRYAI